MLAKNICTRCSFKHYFCVLQLNKVWYIFIKISKFVKNIQIFFKKKVKKFEIKISHEHTLHESVGERKLHILECLILKNFFMDFFPLLSEHKSDFAFRHFAMWLRWTRDFPPNLLCHQLPYLFWKLILRFCCGGTHSWNSVGDFNHHY